VDWVTNNPLPGRTIQACNRIDPSCSNPLPVVATIVDSEKNVTVELPAGQNVFLVLTAGVVGTTVPTVLYFDGALYSDQTGGRIQVLTIAAIQGLAQQLQVPLNGGLGVLAIRAHDCKGNIVGGALYSSSDPSGMSIPYTFVNGLPRAAMPPMPGTSTTIQSDNSPWAGFVNVPAGAVTIDGILADGGREFGTADIQVRNQFVNAVEVRALDHL